MSEETKKEITQEEAAAEAKKYSSKVTEDDVADMVGKEEKMKGFFANVASLKKYWDDACDMFSLLKDRSTGKYTETPWRTIAAIVGVLVYVMSPFDLVPDFIPLAGYLDDATVFAFVLSVIQDDLESYREWRRKEENTINVEG